MARITVVCSIDQSLQLWNIVWMGKVDDVDVHVISLQTLAEFFAGSFILFNGMADENDDSLPLILVHTMLQR